MNGDDVIRMIEDNYTDSRIVTCIHCGKAYWQETIEQTPGFRDMDFDNCPYCNEENGRSMTYEYSNRPLTDEEQAKLSN